MTKNMNIMYHIIFIVLSHVILISKRDLVYGYPNEAGSCDANIASVGGLHVEQYGTRQVLEQTNADAGVDVSLRRNGNPTKLSILTTPIMIGTEYEIVVTATESMRGILIRYDVLNITKTLNPNYMMNTISTGINTQLALVCEAPIYGVCHINSDEKSIMSSKMLFTEKYMNNYIMNIDITIVFYNTRARSSYSYGKYTLRLVNPVPVSVQIPVPTIPVPVPLPVPVPVPKPLPVPKPVPVPRPVPRPVPKPVVTDDEYTDDYDDSVPVPVPKQPALGPVSVSKPVIATDDEYDDTIIDDSVPIPLPVPKPASVPAAVPKPPASSDDDFDDAIDDFGIDDSVPVPLPKPVAVPVPVPKINSNPVLLPVLVPNVRVPVALPIAIVIDPVVKAPAPIVKVPVPVPPFGVRVPSGIVPAGNVPASFPAGNAPSVQVPVVRVPIPAPIVRVPSVAVAVPVGNAPQVPIPPVPVPNCLSGSNIVYVKGRGEILLSNLKIGDYVKTSSNNNQDDYTQVYSFGHYHHEYEMEFIQIHYVVNNNNTSNDMLKQDQQHKQIMPLEISSQHFLYVKSNEIDVDHYNIIRADHVRLGDILYPYQIETSIRHITRNGVYAPWTMSGDIIVNGIRTSCYVDILFHNENDANTDNSNNNDMILWNQHELGHIWTTPYRTLCRNFMNICKKVTYNDMGYNHFAYRMILILDTMINYFGSRYTYMMINVLSIPIFIACYILEFIMIIPSYLSLMCYCCMVGVPTIIILFYMQYHREK